MTTNGQVTLENYTPNAPVEVPPMWVCALRMRASTEPLSGCLTSGDRLRAAHDQCGWFLHGGISG